MIQFKRLRLNGFKSFIDRTEIDIGPGLNGIVGPNGCGKSNLVEAMRWVMGESSARRMRGDGMDDVIFGGTEKRNARHMAEVSLLLDNAARTAPSPYNDSDEIEIVRRIERDHGSVFKINGKTVRARDVQLLFADTVTGANSPALVSQGRVTQIINAKPLERRLILEESAGISGLFARRHEAELRLKAADRNMVRIQDVIGGIETQLSALKRQARQAIKYKTLSKDIKRIETWLAWLDWRNLVEKIHTAQTEFNQAETETAALLINVSARTTDYNTCLEALPALRSKDAEAAAALQSRKLELQRLEDEITRHQLDLEQTQEQYVQAQADRAHERNLLDEAELAFCKLEAEQEELGREQQKDPQEMEAYAAKRDALDKDVRALEERYNTAMQGEAEIRARRQALEQQARQNNDRLTVLQNRRNEAQAELDGFASYDELKDAKTKLDTELEKTSALYTRLEQDHDQALLTLESAEAKLTLCRREQDEAQTGISALHARIEALEQFFAKDPAHDRGNILEAMNIRPGFEKALSRALGDAVMAGMDKNAESFWIKRNNREGLPALPEGATSLRSVIEAPDALRDALDQIGLVESRDDGERLFTALAPGQALVSGAGDYWRWDGYCIKAEATDRNARILEQKTQLKALNAKQPELEKILADKTKAMEQAARIHGAAQDKAAQLQAGIKDAAQTMARLRQVLGETREKLARLESERLRLMQSVAQADEDMETLREVMSWDNERMAGLEKDAGRYSDQELDELRRDLQAARERLQQIVTEHETHRHAQNTRKARQQAIGDERVNLQNRIIRSRERIKALETREADLACKLEDLKDRPQVFEAGKQDLQSGIHALEIQRSEAADNLAEAETSFAQAAKAQKEAESALGAIRERRAHFQATLSGLTDQQEIMRGAIDEHFGTSPEQLRSLLDAEDLNKSEESPDTLRREKEILTRDRDALGAVNLRAEEEATTMEASLSDLLNERNDLEAAISELRAGIQKINREARERLLTAFNTVNAHFQSLFRQLFGGGDAYLSLLDSDDPLEAGLEIYAQPPGKTLQSLSLLSGGEQTLTSIALIFAMFLTNPSPICVLDEIDAPLDDSNVDRVCDLLEDIAERGFTRFLIVTHHRLTMARMHRLFGVTMSEKGVSQLVSVDLQQKFEFQEAA